MSITVFTKFFNKPSVNEKEILRYAGGCTDDKEVISIMKSCIDEVCDKLCYKVCYCELNVCVNDDICDFGYFSLKSKNLAQNLKKCKKAIMFAATCGIEIDRLIGKYSKISPLKALMMQAIGAERIEALCDEFTKSLKEEIPMSFMPRFSPGYGDLPLDAQKEIFDILDCHKKIGLTLNDSLLMTPTKSVTAFIGLYDE